MLHTNRELLQKARLLHMLQCDELETLLKNKDVLSLAELINAGFFNDAIWCCIRNAVLPEEKQTLEHVRVKILSECVRNVRYISTDSSLEHGSWLASQTLQAAANNDFYAVLYAIMAKSTAAREAFEKTEKYVKARNASMKTWARMAATCAVLSHELEELSTMVLLPECPAEIRKNFAEKEKKLKQFMVLERSTAKWRNRIIQEAGSVYDSVKREVLNYYKEYFLSLLQIT